MGLLQAVSSDASIRAKSHGHLTSNSPLTPVAYTLNLEP